MYPQHLSWLCMLDFLLMLQVKLPFVNKIQLQSDKFPTSVENKATGDIKINDSPDKRNGLTPLIK